uniref:Uncharacterized protein n=1 Tax=Chelonoidis abingdonii TaxID=106734 RepID=A0A8C0IKX3_CHEAB
MWSWHGGRAQTGGFWGAQHRSLTAPAPPPQAVQPVASQGSSSFSCMIPGGSSGRGYDPYGPAQLPAHMGTPSLGAGTSTSTGLLSPGVSVPVQVPGGDPEVPQYWPRL